MKPYEIENAIISDTFLGVEDHGILTATLQLNFSGGHAILWWVLI